MHINNLCTTETWSYVDTFMYCNETQLNKLLLYFIIFSIISYETDIAKAMQLKRENIYEIGLISLTAYLLRALLQ
jgi:hypothetical protein